MVFFDCPPIGYNGIPCMHDEDEYEEDRRSINLESWDTALNEVIHYLAQGSDYFTVSVGPWTITYDVNESEGINDHDLS